MTATTLNRPVLVLNKNWQAVNVVTAKKAYKMLSKLYSEDVEGINIETEPRARVIDVDDLMVYDWTDWTSMEPKDGGFVVAGDTQFRVPEVILLSRYDKLPNRKVKFSRRHVYRRDNYECQYCGENPGTELLTIDHVMPRSRGGKTTWENCVLACLDCNSRKADRTPEECRMQLRKVPKKPMLNLFKADQKYRPQSWRQFVSAAYWEGEMKNDNKD